MGYTAPVKGSDGVYRKAATTPPTKTTSIIKSIGSNIINRVENAGRVLGIATGIYNPDHDTIVASTPWKPVNKVLELASNHPYTTAGVATAAYYAAPYVASGATKLVNPLTTGGVALGAVNLAKNPVVIGGAGLLLGGLAASLFNGGQKQNTNATQPTSTYVFPEQKTTQNPTSTTNPEQSGSPWGLTGDKNIVTYNYRQSQDTAANYYYDAMASPSQSVPTTVEPSQDVSPSQTSSGTNWLLIAGIAAGAYLLAKN